MLVHKRAESERSRHTGRLRILVIEDDVETAKLLRKILERAGYISRCVNSYREALRMAAEWVPDALVSDIGLPGKDGLEVMKTMRRAYPGLKGIVVSGHVHPEHKIKSLSVGFDAHLAKPITADQLIDAVGQLFIHAKEGHGD